MKKLRLGLAVACISLSMLATSCRTDQSLASFLGNEEEDIYYASNKPNFIDNIALGSNNNDISIDNGISMNTVERHNKLNNQTDAIVMSAINRDVDKEAAKINPAEGNTLAGKYASILGVMPNMLCNYSLYKFIDEWYGVRYRLGGTDKSGIDCSAFVQRLYEQVFRTDVLRTAFEQFQNVSLTSSVDNLKEGDLVFFKIRGKRISHVGIYLMNNFFVHASRSQGVMISSLNEGYWQHFFAGAGQIMRGNNG